MAMDLIHQVQEVKQKLEGVLFNITVDVNQIYEELEQHRVREDRVDFVASLFLNRFGINSCSDISIGDDLPTDMSVDEMTLAKKNECEVASTGLCVDGALCNNERENETSTSASELSSKVLDSCPVGLQADVKVEMKSCRSKVNSGQINESEEIGISVPCSSRVTSVINLPSSSSELDSFSPARLDFDYDVNNNDPNNNTEYEMLPDVVSSSNNELSTASLHDQETDYTHMEFSDQEHIREKLLSEARVIHTVVPQRTFGEIYSFLESNLDNENRLQVVMKYFLNQDFPNITAAVDAESQSTLNPKSVHSMEQVIDVDKSEEADSCVLINETVDCNTTAEIHKTSVVEGKDSDSQDGIVISDDETTGLPESDVEVLYEGENICEAIYVDCVGKNGKRRSWRKTEASSTKRSKTSDLTNVDSVDSEALDLSLNCERFLDNTYHKHFNAVKEMFPNLGDKHLTKVCSAYGETDDDLLRIIDDLLQIVSNLGNLCDPIVEPLSTLEESDLMKKKYLDSPTVTTKSKVVAIDKVSECKAVTHANNAEQRQNCVAVFQQSSSEHGGQNCHGTSTSSRINNCGTSVNSFLESAHVNNNCVSVNGSTGSADSISASMDSKSTSVNSSSTSAISSSASLNIKPASANGSSRFGSSSYKYIATSAQDSSVPTCIPVWNNRNVTNTDKPTIPVVEKIKIRKAKPANVLDTRIKEVAAIVAATCAKFAVPTSEFQNARAGIQNKTIVAVDKPIQITHPIKNENSTRKHSHCSTSRDTHRTQKKSLSERKASKTSPGKVHRSSKLAKYHSQRIMNVVDPTPGTSNLKEGDEQVYPENSETRGDGTLMPTATPDVLDETNEPGTSGTLNNSTQVATAELITITNTAEEEKQPTAEGDALQEQNKMEDCYECLLSIFPQADPTYLLDKCIEIGRDEEKMRVFIADALEKKDYPTYQDYQKRMEVEKQKKKVTTEFSVESFLEIFPDPLKYFLEQKQSVHVEPGLVFLKNRYPRIRCSDICSMFRNCQYNLTKTCQMLDKLKIVMKTRRPLISDMVNKDDLQFLQEVAFIENRTLIEAHINNKEAQKILAFEEAKARGELLECSCCFNDEVLLEDIGTCNEGHLFCKGCIQKSAEVQIGDGKTTFPCLTTCDSEFSLKTLQTVLKASVLSKVLQTKQLEEVKAASIDGIEFCPYCNFATILPEEDKVFHCLNPECMKESCRMCKEPNHVPKRCDEIEKSDEVSARTYIENKMSEALIRVCWNCKKPFIKEDGCNKMTCSCGAMMCYICRQKVTDYSHFNGQGGSEFHKCPLYSTNDELHVDVVKKEAIKAKQEIMQQNPTVHLKHDPTKVLPKPTQVAPVPGYRQAYEQAYQQEYQPVQDRLMANVMNRLHDLYRFHQQRRRRQERGYHQQQVPPPVIAPAHARNAAYTRAAAHAHAAEHAHGPVHAHVHAAAPAYAHAPPAHHAHAAAPGPAATFAAAYVAARNAFNQHVNAERNGPPGIDVYQMNAHVHGPRNNRQPGAAFITIQRLRPQQLFDNGDGGVFVPDEPVPDVPQVPDEQGDVNDDLLL